MGSPVSWPGILLSHPGQGMLSKCQSSPWRCSWCPHLAGVLGVRSSDGAPRRCLDLEKVLRKEHPLRSSWCNYRLGNRGGIKRSGRFPMVPRGQGALCSALLSLLCKQKEFVLSAEL